MQQESAQPGLFWAALILVALAAVMILAKPLLGLGERRRPTRWLVALACLFPASVAPARAPASVTIPGPAGHYGWSSIHCPIDHKPDTSRHLLQQT